MPRAILIALGAVVILGVLQVAVGMSHLNEELQQQLRARQQRSHEEWDRGYRLCRCELCCQVGPSYERDNFVIRTRPPVHARAHVLVGDGLFCHYTRDELYAEHLAVLSGVEQPQQPHRSDSCDIPSPPRDPADSQQPEASGSSRNTTPSSSDHSSGSPTGSLPSGELSIQ